VLRLLDMLEVASPQARFNLYQTELLNYSHSEVRSRAALLLARNSKSAALDQFLGFYGPTVGPPIFGGSRPFEAALRKRTTSAG